MSLIEQAAKRLAQLQRAGAEVPDRASTGESTARAGAPRQDQVPTPERMMRELHARAATVETTPPIAPDIGSPGVPLELRKRTADTREAPKVTVSIDLDHLKAQGFVVPDDPQSQIAQEFRVLKRPIIRNAMGRTDAAGSNRTLVQVTSALPGEGKTFVATNLAISMAMELDNTVLLIDGDAAHPSLPNVLGIPPSTGLLDLLIRDDLDLDDVLLQTNLEKLTLLPAGSPHRRATELLASERMASLLRELVSRYPDRIIVFDSPPLLATTEAPVLASLMGQVVMVVAADSTSQKAVSEALATIERCEVVLMMLNKSVRTNVGAYYGYYAGDDPH